MKYVVIYVQLSDGSFYVLRNGTVYCARQNCLESQEIRTYYIRLHKDNKEAYAC